MKKSILLITLFIINLHLTAQSKEDTELFLSANLEKLNSFLITNNLEDKKNDISIMTQNYMYENWLSYAEIYSKYYMKKNNIKFPYKTTIIDISKIYSIQLININDKTNIIEIKSKSNCFEFNDKTISVYEYKNLKNSPNNCKTTIFLYNDVDLNIVNRNIKALSHLVQIYGGKIIDDIF